METSTATAHVTNLPPEELCPDGWEDGGDGGLGHCYIFLDCRDNFHNAQNMCSERDATLVDHFEDTFENQLVAELIYRHFQWFDLKDPDFYAWVDYYVEDEREQNVVDSRDGSWGLRDADEDHWVLCKRQEIRPNDA